MNVTLFHVESFGNYNWFHLVKYCEKLTNALECEGSSIVYQYSVARKTSVK